MIEVGDWVSFYRDNTIIYGEVRYIRERIGLSDELCTDHGAISYDCVLEARKSRITLGGDDD